MVSRFCCSEDRALASELLPSPRFLEPRQRASELDACKEPAEIGDDVGQVKRPVDGHHVLVDLRENAERRYADDDANERGRVNAQPQYREYQEAAEVNQLIRCQNKVMLVALTWERKANHQNGRPEQCVDDWRAQHGSASEALVENEGNLRE